MKRFAATFALAVLIATPLAAKPAPVDVTRFHTAQTLPRLKGAAIIVELAPGSDPASLEDGLWREAVARELTAAGFGSATPGAADGIAQVMVERETIRRENRRGPVSVGVGGQTGGWGSGLGVGLGFNLGGGPKDVVLTRLSVRIRDRVSGEALWEGRAETRENAKAKEAAPALTAPRLAHALFTGFPGTSGETISVK
ncbi:DUF4136 domain-containing protein [Novosphingobium sp.]|uniref:DUF4136 domain-containing protein n=1 Tax=Novosphingobium sp. TaxID=1874826 RepID=UPI0035691843